MTHNVPRFEGDAAGSFVLRLAVALQQEGHAVDIIAPGEAGLPANSVLEGVCIDRVRYGTDANMMLAYRGTMAESVRGSWRGKFALVGLLRALRSATRAHLDAATREGQPYHVVHAHWWFPAALALWRFRRPSDPPMAITMHGSDVRLAATLAPAQKLMRAVLRAASVRTAVSSWLADTASRIAPDLRIHVEPMPVDTRHFAAAPPVNGSTRAGVLFVGRLNAQKGIAVLLEIMAEPALRAAVLDVVGDGPDAHALQTRAAALGIAHRVRWHGTLPQPELVPLYQCAAVVAMPSTDEGLGLVAVEAQLCETPVVAFASGGLPDVVRMDAGGTLVTPGDTRAFATSLARLLDDPSLARRCGVRARDAMLSHFAPTEVAARYVKRYREAIDM
ncbi:MAG TPA: glycosyltransferase [Gemmatimonas sp.]|nr:glycosyltransferase [Gemmatimonas sp.]